MTKLNCKFLVGAAASVTVGAMAMPACAVVVPIGGNYVVPPGADDVTVFVQYKNDGSVTVDVPFAPDVKPGDKNLDLVGAPDAANATATFVKWTFPPLVPPPAPPEAVAVPEPATWAMMLIGIGGLGAALRASISRGRPAFR